MKFTTAPYGFNRQNWNSVLFRAMRTTPQREEKTQVFGSNTLTAPFRSVAFVAWDPWVPLHPVLRETLEKLPRSCRHVFPFRSRKTGDP
jgi:hypothetical protein